MILTNPPIVFYNRDNEIVAGVVEMPEEPKGQGGNGIDSLSEEKELCQYREDLEQALLHPIPFKDKEDERKVGYQIFRKNAGLSSVYHHWLSHGMELRKPYKFEEEIEIREEILTWDDFGNKNKTMRFAFLKPKEKSKWDGSTYPYHPNNVLVIEQKDVLDTGARLPEQKEEEFIGKVKEEDQELQKVLFNELFDLYDADKGAVEIMYKFGIYRKP